MADLNHMRALFERIESGDEFEVVIECGGDETIVWFKLNSKSLERGSKVSKILRDRLVDQFDLPNSGQYYVDGTGTFSVDGNKLMMTYRLQKQGYRWDPKTNEEHRIDEEIDEGTAVVHDLDDD